MSVMKKLAAAKGEMLVGLVVAPVQAASTYCYAGLILTDGPDRYFRGACDVCDENAFYFAIAKCESTEIMVEYMCEDVAYDELQFVCHELGWD